MKVYFHRADLDGIGSAAVVYDWYMKNKPEEMPEFIGFDYKDDSDKIINSIEKDETVWFVDCCLEPNSKLLELFEKTQDIHLLDHHGTSLKSYEKLMTENQYFFCYDVDLENAKNNSHSGIYLVWKKLYPEIPVPKVVDYVSKYDTWNHKNDDDIVDFYVGLNHHIYNPKYGYKNGLWQILFAGDEPRFQSITSDGKTIREYLERQNYSHCLEGLIEVEICGAKGVALNTPYRGSANIQGINKSDYNFTMVFVCLGDTWRYSVYCDNKDYDVSIIAKHFGGGGHIGAAGFQTKELIEEIKNGKKVF